MIRRKQIGEGYVYEATEMRGPFLDFTVTKENGDIIVKFGRAYAEDASKSEGTYIERAIEALKDLLALKHEDENIYLDAWGKRLEISRDSDVETLVKDFVIKNANLNSKDAITERDERDAEIKVNRRSVLKDDSRLDYFTKEYGDYVSISIGERTATSENDPSYSQMSVAAIKSTDEETDSSKKIEVKMPTGIVINIPRGADESEITAVIEDYILKNATFYESGRTNSDKDQPTL